MNDIMEEYTKIVEFLGRVLGDNCEIVLQDVRKGKNCIVAIVNGQVSGRKIGSPLTDFGREVLVNGNWKGKDYYDNYTGLTKQNKPLRSSTYFIKENNKLVGMLCINIDDTKYLELSDMLLRLGGVREHQGEEITASMMPAEQSKSSGSEVFYGDINDVVDSTIEGFSSKFASDPISRLTQAEKIEIVRKLNEKRVFMIKGAVNQVAGKLGISVASLYRYLSAIAKEKTRDAKVSIQNEENGEVFFRKH